MRMKSMFGFISMGTLALCLSLPQYANAASAEEEVLQVKTNFIKALSAGDFTLMSSLYWHSSKTSTFAPDSPSFLLQGWDDSLEKYWKSSFGSPTGTTKITLMIFLNPRVTMLKDDLGVINGYEYIVDTDPTTKKETTTQLRITRIVQKIEGKWLIVNDHASTFPVK
jgi:hypothetical protein